MQTEPYADQAARWPIAGRVILADFDEDTIVVYQAFRPAIAQVALEAQRFVGPFSLGRMSWVKPNFLWMMYRSGWATKEGQEYVLRVRIARAGFDAILAAAVPSAHDPARWATRAEWEAAGKRADVRLQWDPDHGPGGDALPRRAIQLGLRGEVLRRYVEDWTVSIEDLTPFVAEQRAAWKADRASLVTPLERPYPATPALAAQLGLTPPDAASGAER